MLINFKLNIIFPLRARVALGCLKLGLEVAVAVVFIYFFLLAAALVDRPEAGGEIWEREKFG